MDDSKKQDMRAKMLAKASVKAALLTIHQILGPEYNHLAVFLSGCVQIGGIHGLAHALAISLSAQYGEDDATKLEIQESVLKFFSDFSLTPHECKSMQEWHMRMIGQ